MNNILTSNNELEKIISESVNPIKETIEIPEITLENVMQVLGKIKWRDEEIGFDPSGDRWETTQKTAGRNGQAQATWFSHFDKMGDKTGMVMVLKDPTGELPYTKVKCTDLTEEVPRANTWEIGEPTE